MQTFINISNISDYSSSIATNSLVRSNQGFNKNLVTKVNGNIGTTPNYNNQIRIPVELTFQLVSENTFSCADPQNDQMRTIFTQNNGQIFGETSWWIFPIGSHEPLRRALVSAFGVNQIQKFLPGLISYTDINVVMNSKSGFNGLVNIVSYDLVRNVLDKIMEKGFKVVIADESHFLKNQRAKRTEATTKVIRAANRRILLTGTPALSRPIDLLQQILCIIPRPIQWTDFVYRYCAAYKDKFNRLNYFGCSNMKELNLFLNTFMIRRLKNDVLTELPDKRREKIQVEVKKADMKKIKEVQDMIKEANSIASKTDEQKVHNSKVGTKKSLLLKLFRDTGLGKLPAIDTFLKEKLESFDGKFLIFAHHTAVLDGIEAVLVKQKVGYIRIDGSTPVHSRAQYVSAFQTEDTIKVAVLSLLAAGTGLTLTAANLVIFAELYWTPGSLFQAEDRAHRIGQKNSVLIQYLVGIGTVDEHIWNMIESKKEVLGRVLDDEYVEMGADVADNKKEAPKKKQKDDDSTAKKTKINKEDLDEDDGGFMDTKKKSRTSIPVDMNEEFEDTCNITDLIATGGGIASDLDKLEAFRFNKRD
eukprot:gene15748-18711_t